jgi:hypothetical protein
LVGLQLHIPLNAVENRPETSSTYSDACVGNENVKRAKMGDRSSDATFNGLLVRDISLYSEEIGIWW